MVLMGVVLDDLVTARRFLGASEKRLQSNDIIRSPFRGHIKMRGAKEMFFAILDLQPLYPNPAAILWLLGVVAIIFNPPPIFYALPFVVGVGAFTHTRVFMLIVLKVALRKAGYAGQVKLMSWDAFARRIL